MCKVIINLLLINYITAYPLFKYQTISDDDVDIPCYDVREYYTSAFIINRSIMYSSNITNTNKNNIHKFNLLEKNKTQNNITFHGLVVLEYKTLPHCSYTCDMLVIENQKSSSFISTHFKKYFQIGSVLHMFCNNTICTWGNVVCNAYKIRDEL